jgi:gamma-glutamylcyclotransferase (GGCT)/AIG2-like uncharacterized protein YtfP
MVNVFTYGSLMFDPVWSRVVAGSYERCEGILQGYDRKGVRNEIYPVIVPSAAESQVQGLVYLDVSAADLALLDRFEGLYFFRKPEQVITADKAILSAEVYVLKEEYYTIISPREWDPVHFSTTGIYFFIHRYMETDEQ